MPLFTERMLQVAEQQLSDQEQDELSKTLRDIYGADCRDYHNKDNDFEVCKAQLLALLHYIYELNNHSLALFHVFADNVSKLLNSSPEIDIDVLLKSTKHSIESTLLAIINRHSHIDNNAFGHLTVNACYQGAAASIEQALSRFKTSELSFWVKTAQSECLLQLAKDYLTEHQLFDIPVGNEIHLINTLYNYVSDDYGLITINDAFIGGLDDETLNDWVLYLVKQFTVSYFLRYCQISFEPPPNTIIDSAETLKSLHHFFRLFEQPFKKETYLQLYDEDEGNSSLKPKAQFLFVYGCMLADYLQQAGFIAGLTTTINDKTYLYNGEQLVQFTADESCHYHALSFEQLRPLIDEPKLSSLRLWRQLEPNLLLERYLNERNDEYFEYLLTLPLTESMILTLWNALDQQDQDTKAELAVYVFTHTYDDFTLQQLDEISLAIPEFLSQKVINYAIATDDIVYLPSLLQRFQQLLDDNTFISFIFLAAESGAVNIITYLSNLYVDLAVKDDEGQTLAHIAALNGHVNIITKLHDLKLDLEAKDNGGRTPAHLAARNGHVDVITKLHDLKIDLDAKSNYGWTPAHFAACNGHVNIITKLHDLNIDDLKIDLDAKDNDGSTLAHIAAFKGHVNVITKLHDLKIDLTVKNNYGWTLAHYAARNGQIDVITKLHDLKIDLDAKDNDGWTLAHYAALNGQIDVITKLHDLKIDLNAKDNDGCTPAHLAAQVGHIDVITKLHDLKIDLNAKDNSGRTLAHIAAFNGYIDVITKLHDLKIDLTVKNNYGWTLAHYVALNGHVNMITKLHELGIAWDAKENNGFTPAHFASLNGHINFITKLKEFNLSLNNHNAKLPELNASLKNHDATPPLLSINNPVFVLKAMAAIFALASAVALSVALITVIMITTPTLVTATVLTAAVATSAVTGLGALSLLGVATFFHYRVKNSQHNAEPLNGLACRA